MCTIKIKSALLTFLCHITVSLNKLVTIFFSEYNKQKQTMGNEMSEWMSGKMDKRPTRRKKIWKKCFNIFFSFVSMRKIQLFIDPCKLNSFGIIFFFISSSFAVVHRCSFGFFLRSIHFFSFALQMFNVFFIVSLHFQSQLFPSKSNTCTKSKFELYIFFSQFVLNSPQFKRQI